MKRLCSSRGFVLPLAALLLAALPASTALAQQQSASITGTVKSETGQPIENANAYIQELNLSTGTNAQGRFTLVIPAERVRGQAVVLRVRAIAHLAQSRPVTVRAGNQTIDFELKKDINRLEEVVVTGMSGATEQRKTTFAITALTAEQDMPVASVTPLEGLAGKVAGASVVGGNGRPGTAPAILLRGAHSINATNRGQGPLIIVDGIILNGNSTDIDPESIESVEIVKGAAGGSMYGSLAENGIISIRTKRATNESRALRIDARQETGFSDIQGTYHFPTTQMLQMNEDGTRFCINRSGLPNCAQTVDWDTEAARINNVPTAFTATPYALVRDYGFSTAPPSTQYEIKGLFMINEWPKRYNPVDQVKASNAYINSTVSLTGKNGGTSYFSSFNQTIQNGAVKYQQGYQRQSGRANVDQQIGSDFTTSLQMMFSRGRQFPDQTSWFGVTRTHAGANLNQFDAFGRLYYRPDITSETSQDSNDNPNYFQLYRNVGETDINRYLGSMTSHYTPTGWLTFEATTAIDERRTSGAFVTDKGFRTAASTSANDGNMSTSDNYDLSYNVLVNGTATHNFGKDLATRWDVRYSFDDQNSHSESGSGSTLTLPGLQTLRNATTSLQPLYTNNAQRALGYSSGLNLDYKDRYILDGSIRREGSSLFGIAQRWHDYSRASLAWLASEEPWWFLPSQIDQFKFRAAVGTAGGRPAFDQQYEVYNLGTGGSITASTLGNKDLRPEHALETEYGIDAEFFHKYGLQLTYARDITTDQIMQVPPSVSSGFSSQWQNAGTMDSRTWEVSLNVPLINHRSLAWTSRLNWDQTRSYITAMNVPDFFAANTNSNIRYAVGERYGNVYGWQFVKSCGQLPSDFQGRCGAGKDFQANDKGYIVWVGAGNSWQDGVTKNLWQAKLLGCTVKGVPTNTITGSANCLAAGGTVNTPWGQPTMNWGMPIEVRDSTGFHKLSLLGNSQPLWHVTWAHNVSFKRVNGYLLLDKMFGNHVYNEDRQWSFGDFMAADEDQRGQSVETAKPIGYYWRATAPDNGAGVGGFYSVLGPNSVSFEDASYLKLREASVTYNIGVLRKLPGDWSLSIIGRNLYTWTKYQGWDPDIGAGGGNTNSGAIFSAQSSAYPASRTFSFTLGSKF